MYPKELIDKVWRKAKEEQGFNPDFWRKDFAGAWIRRDSFGRNSSYGWCVDHSIPLRSGGTNELENLWPIHWKNNIAKGSDYPVFTTVVTSEGKTNVEKTQQWRTEQKET